LNSTPSLQHSDTPVLVSDYHSHPQGHRVQRYTQALLQPWIDSARAKGILDIAFTDHDRYHGVSISTNSIVYVKKIPT